MDDKQFFTSVNNRVTLKINSTWDIKIFVNISDNGMA